MTAYDPIDPALVSKAARAILASGAVTTCPGDGLDGAYCEGCESEAYIVARAVLEAVAADLWDEGCSGGENNQINRCLPRRQITNPYRQETDR